MSRRRLVDVTWRLGSLSFRMSRRAIWVSLALLLVLVSVASLALTLGDYPITAWEALQALFGGGGDPLASYFVQDQRAPRVVAGVLVGAALGASGCIFQSLSGNPLASPDIIGFTIGAASGAIIQLTLFDAGPAATALGALLGGFGTAAVVYFLAYRQGLSGYRLVLVGVGVAAVLQGLNSLLIVRASLSAAQSAAQWLAGSLNATLWPETALLALAMLILLPAAIALARPLRVMTSGDELAISLGVPIERRRLELVVVGVALVSVATAVAGPIAFVALAAPQLARALLGGRSLGMFPAALMGALLVVSSDVIAQRVFAPTQLPVGVVTGTLGGIYLIGLLAFQARRSGGLR